MRLKSFGMMIRHAFNMLFPSYCAVCGRRLTVQEHCLCTSCFVLLPFTRWKGREGNVVERIFWARVPIERANAYLYYEAGADSTRLVHALKYNNQPYVGKYFGRLMAADLENTDFFNSIDCILPLPLAKKKLRRRGYNQSLMLAKGISQKTHIPIISDAVVRTIANPSQTSLSKQERIENVRGIFHLKKAEKLKGKHVLIVDDVITTGSTLLSCAEEVAKAEDVRISILSMYKAGKRIEMNTSPI